MSIRNPVHLTVTNFFMRMIANIIIKVRNDILKCNIIFSVRHQKKIRILRRGKNEKGGVGRKEQKSVTEAP